MLLLARAAGGADLDVLSHRVRGHSAQPQAWGGEAFLAEPPGSARGVPARLAWWSGAVAGCSQPRSGRAARACVCV